MIISYQAFFAFVALVTVLTERDVSTTALVAFAANIALDTLLVLLYVNMNSTNTRSTGPSYSIFNFGIERVSTVSNSVSSSVGSSRPFYKFPNRLTTDLVLRSTTDLIVFPSLPAAPTCPLSGDLILAPAFELILYGAHAASEVSLLSMGDTAAPSSGHIFFGSDEVFSASISDAKYEDQAQSTALIFAPTFDLVAYAGPLSVDMISLPSLTASPISGNPIVDGPETAATDSVLSDDLLVYDSDSSMAFGIADGEETPDIIFNSILPNRWIYLSIDWACASHRSGTSPFPGVREDIASQTKDPFSRKSARSESKSWLAERGDVTVLAILYLMVFNFLFEWYDSVQTA